METALMVASNIIAFLTAQWGVAGTVLAYAIVWGIPVISVLIEVLELVVVLTPSSEDDVWAKRAKAVWAKAMPWLEALPHVNLPLSKGAQLVMKIIVKVGAAIKGAVQGLLLKK